MAKDWAKWFYESVAWIKCRAAFMRSKLYICERCGEVAKIAHHKEYLTPDNIDNPEVTLNWDNLECLCQDCHNKEHHKDEYKVTAEGVVFDEFGQLVQAPLKSKHR